MDHNPLKGRPPFPFETFAAAVTFSQNLGPLLSEARQLAHAFRAKLLLIHIGQHTPGNEARFQEMCQQIGIGQEVRIIWSDVDPVVSLLGIYKENMVDLLVLTEPKVVEEMVADCVNHQKTIPTLNTAFYFAHRVGCHEMRVVREVDQVGLAMALSDDSTTGEQSSVKEQLFIERKRDDVRYQRHHLQRSN